MPSSKTVRGFTLIELLMVIAIIGILSSVVLNSLGTSRIKARDAARISQMRQIKYGLELYFATNNAYPACLYTTGCAGTHLEGSTFMPLVPKDATGSNYDYAAFGSGATCTSYHLGFTLETTNPVLISDADKKTTDAPTTLCTNSAADFSGLGTAVAGGGGCNTTNGVAQGSAGATELCYDLIP